MKVLVGVFTVTSELQIKTLDLSALIFFKWTASRDVISQKGLPGYPAYSWRRRVQGRRDPLCF
jgi:hypothetical protein